MEHARDTKEPIIRVLASGGSYLADQIRAVSIGCNSGVVATWIVVAECWLEIAAHRLLVAFELLWHLIVAWIVENIAPTSRIVRRGQIADDKITLTLLV